MFSLKAIVQTRINDLNRDRLSLLDEYFSASPVWFLIDIRGDNPSDQLFFRVVCDTHFVVLPDDFVECDCKNKICLFQCVRKLVTVALGDETSPTWKNQLRTIEKETKAFSELELILDYIEEIIDVE